MHRFLCFRLSVVLLAIGLVPLLSSCVLFVIDGNGKKSRTSQGSPSPGSAKTLADGYWTGTGTSNGLNTTVWGMGMYKGSLYAGGDLTHVGTTYVGRCARWDGTAWQAMGSGIFGTDANQFCVMGDDLYVGSNFTTAGGIATKNIARWNGSAWSAFGNNHFGGPIDHIFVHQGALHVLARTYDSVGAPAILSRWNGTSWDDIGSFDAWADKGLSEGGVLYVVGRFHTVSGVAARGVAKWEGGTWSAMGPGLGGPSQYLEVNDIVRYRGDLIAVGEIYSTGDGLTTINGMARWTGSTWVQFAGGASGGTRLRGAAVFGDELIVCGDFTSVGGVAANSIAWWDGTTWHPFGAGANAGPTCLLVDADGFWIGGGFTAVDGTSTRMVARWNAGDPPMPKANN